MSFIWLHGSERFANLLTNLLYAALAAAVWFAICYVIIKSSDRRRKK